MPDLRHHAGGNCRSAPLPLPAAPDPDRLRMGKFEALLLIAAMLLESSAGYSPGRRTGANIGGMIIPAAICFYLIARLLPEEKVRG